MHFVVELATHGLGPLDGQRREKLFDRTIAEDVIEYSLAVLRLRHGGVKHSST